MNDIHLGIPYAHYEHNLAHCSFDEATTEKIASLLDGAGPGKVLVYGAGRGTGASVRRIVGERFAGYINSDTFDDEHRYAGDVVVIATGPEHYAAIKQTLARNGSLAEKRIVTLFDAKSPDRNLVERPCHYSFLYVRSDGNAYPCCSLWSPGDRPVFNVRDDDIGDKMRRYDCGECTCRGLRFKPAAADDVMNVSNMIVATSLQCNSQCAMCNHHCPEFTKERRHDAAYEADKRDRLVKAIAAVRPRNLIVHGGEVLIHPEELEWLRSVKETFPDISLEIVTNGNVNPEIADRMFHSVDRCAIGYYGFQPETYRMITRMNIARTMAFTERALAVNRSGVYLKYLATPLTLHEAPAFLRWALEKKPRGIAFTDAGTQDYITFDRNFVIQEFDYNGRPKDLPKMFWARIVQRSVDELREVVKKNEGYVSENGIELSFGGGIFDLFPIR